MLNPDKPMATLKIEELNPARPPRVESIDLMRGGSQVHILHAGQTYTLRRTKENKLILTK